MALQRSSSLVKFTRSILSPSGYLLLVLIVGCTSGSVDGKYGVSGEITLDGQPLKTGTISFVSEQGAARPAATMFRDGSYTIAAEKGLKPGKYVVSISSEVASQQPGDVPSKNASNPMMGNIRPAKQIIPAEYNTRSTQIIEVTPDGPNQFDFSIKSN